MPEREARAGLPHRPRLRPVLRAAPRAARPGRRGRPRHRDRGPRGGRGPADRDVLQGHAPARQARRGARPRAAGAAARRAVQRHGPAPAAAHHGAAPGHGGRGPDDPVQLPHPRGGRAAGRAGAGGVRRPPRRVRRLPRDPAAHDGPAAYVHGPLVGRPAAGRGPRRPADGRWRRSWPTARSPSGSSDYAAFVRLIPRAARDAGVTLFELHPADESLERVFSYLVRR